MSEVHQREADFHDEWASTIDPASIDPAAHWNGAGGPEMRWINQQLGDLDGLRVLELGSGAGEGAVWFAQQGATVTATDISPGMLEVVEKVAAHNGVSVSTTVTSADDLSQFEEGSYDLVYAANLLHHVDIDKCAAEVRRVLAPGGRAAFWDPIAYNPAINVYRRLASDVRTDDEHPLKTKDLKTLRRHFDTVDTSAFWLVSLLTFLKFFVVDRLNPGKVRYWKHVVEHQDDMPWLDRLHSIDRAILRVVPPLRWMCWNMAIIGRVRES